MVDSPRTPRIQVSDDFAVAAHQLDGGPLIPLVMQPLVASWAEDTVILREGVRERTWRFPTPGRLPGPSETRWDRDADLDWGVLKIVRLAGTITLPEPSETAEVHMCPGCWTLRPWSIEWITGAVESTGTVECLTCGHRERSAWSARLVSLVGEHYDGSSEGDIEVPKARPRSGTRPYRPYLDDDYRSYLDDDEWQEPWLTSYD